MQFVGKCRSCRDGGMRKFKNLYHYSHAASKGDDPGAGVRPFGGIVFMKLLITGPGAPLLKLICAF